MASVPLSFRATLYDLASKSSRQVYLEGDAFLTGLSVGGGPVIPPPIDGDKPPVIWPNPPEGQAPLPSHPIMLPGMPGWPSNPPPEIPPPGSPPVALGGPTTGIVPPPAVIINYPGVGPVLIPQPVPPPA